MGASPFLFAPNHGDFACVVEIDAGITRRDDLFSALAGGMQFPDHFGRNWDALSDCLKDLSNIDGDVLIVHHDVPLRRSSDERTYLEILIDAQESWAASGDRRIVATFPESCRDEVNELLAES